MECERSRPGISASLRQRYFAAGQPDGVWLTEVSSSVVPATARSPCAAKDVCSRLTVGWSIGHRMTAELVDTVLRMAIAGRRPSGTAIIRADRGS